MGNLRRKDKEAAIEDAYAVIDHCIYASLATVNEDGTPYCVPISIVREDQKLYFHCAKQGKKTDNLRADPSVCISCVMNERNMKDTFSVYYDSAIIMGEAFELEDDEEKRHALRILCERHTPNLMDQFDAEVEKYRTRTAVWRIDAQEIMGKRGRK